MARVGGVRRGGGQAGAAFYMTLRGLDELQAAFEDISGEDLDEEMEQALAAVLEEVKEESQRLVPYDTGLLHDSAYVQVDRSGSGQLTAYAGYDTDYAIFVHENPDAYHDPPTQWKFLEEPFMRMQPDIEMKLAQNIAEFLR